MKLPLSDEVRKARRLAEEAADATGFHLEAGGLLTTLSVLRQTVELGADLERDLPGSELIEKALARFPFLEPVRNAEPEPSAGDLERLTGRIQQIRALQTMLTPYASAQEERSAALHELQHRQHHELIKPEFAEIHEQIHERGEIRKREHLRIADLRHRLATLSPINATLQRFAPAFVSELERCTEREPITIERLRRRIIAVRQMVFDTAAALKLDVQGIAAPSLEAKETDLATLTRAVQAMCQLAELFEQEQDRVSALMQESQRAYQDATDWILDRTG